MSTTADRVRADGAMLTLPWTDTRGRVTDETVRIRFSFTAKREIEKRFGSVVAFERAMNDVLDEGLDAPIVTVCMDGLAAALKGTKWTDDRIEAAMTNDRLGEFFGVLLAAWKEAWPPPKEVDDDLGNAGGTTEINSPGTASSGSPSSTSDSGQRTSGS